MKHISIIVPAGNAILDTIVGSYGMFRMANARYRQVHQLSEDPFEIDLIGLSMDPVTYGGLFQVSPTTTIDMVDQTDLVVVSGISGNLVKVIEKNTRFVEWIKHQRITNNCDIASLCKGALLLAETGLLRGRECATHWTAHNLFRKRYPEVKLIPEKIVTEDRGIYTSGGAYSFLNFLIYLIERYYGRDIAIWCSKVSEIDIDRKEQTQFMIFSGQKEHDDRQIKKAQTFIEQNYDQKISVDDLADRFAVSSRSFLRRFKKATANTPLEYIQRVRVEASKDRLQSSTDSVSQIMYDMGYADSKAFRNTFRKYTGLSPLQYRKKYNWEMANL